MLIQIIQFRVIIIWFQTGINVCIWASMQEIKVKVKELKSNEMKPNQLSTSIASSLPISFAQLTLKSYQSEHRTNENGTNLEHNLSTHSTTFCHLIYALLCCHKCKSEHEPDKWRKKIYSKYASYVDRKTFGKKASKWKCACSSPEHKRHKEHLQKVQTHSHTQTQAHGKR